MPRATMPPRPPTSTCPPSSCPAPPARRVGVMSLAGGFCRSRPALAAPAPPAATATGSGPAGVDQGLQLAAAGVMGDVLALEEPDGDGIGRRVARRVGRCRHPHEGPHHRLSSPFDETQETP